MAEHTQEYSILQIMLNLTVACFISGLIIAAAYYITEPIAERQAKVQEQKTMQALVSDADSFKTVSGKADWHEADKGGKTIAYLVPAETKGYGGAIKMTVAIDTEGKVISYNIDSANETPGLGENASKDPFKSQFKGKSAENLVVTKDKSDTKDIQAMTGATITSRAVTKGVKQAVDEVNEYIKGAK